MKPYDPFDLKFSSHEVTAWGALALLKRMLEGMDFSAGLLQAALNNLGATKVGLFRADSGFCNKVVVDFLADKKITHIISARLTQPLQQTIVGWATKAALGVTMLAYKLLRVFRHAVTHHKVLAVGTFWDSKLEKSEKQTFHLAVGRKRRPWFEGLWASAGEPANLVASL